MPLCAGRVEETAGHSLLRLMWSRVAINVRLAPPKLMTEQQEDRSESRMTGSFNLVVYVSGPFLGFFV